jgi:hypothetical protein
MRPIFSAFIVFVLIGKSDGTMGTRTQVATASLFKDGGGLRKIFSLLYTRHNPAPRMSRLAIQFQAGEIKMSAKTWQLAKNTAEMNDPTDVSTHELPSFGAKHFVEKQGSAKPTRFNHFEPTNISASELPSADATHPIEKSPMPRATQPTRNQMSDAGQTSPKADVHKSWHRKGYPMSTIDTLNDSTNLKKKWGQ